MVNNSKVDIPSYQLKVDDAIAVSEKSRKVGRILQSLEGLSRRGFPEWLELDQEKLVGTVKRLPERQDVTIPIEEQLIVEFYSRV